MSADDSCSSRDASRDKARGLIAGESDEDGDRGEAGAGRPAASLASIGGAINNVKTNMTMLNMRLK